MTSITTATTNNTNNMNSFNSTTSSSSTSVLSNHSTTIMSFPNLIQSPINNNSINVPIINTSQFNLDNLPSNIKFELDQLELELLEGDITQKGYDKKKAKLLAPYLNDSNVVNCNNLTKTNGNTVTTVNNNIESKISNRY
jgi:hypothetical protein